VRADFIESGVVQFIKALLHQARIIDQYRRKIIGTGGSEPENEHGVCVMMQNLSVLY
jgi:hypothetical protein